MRFLLFLLGYHLKLTMARMWIGDACMICCTETIGQQYLIATIIAQHPHTVCRLLLTKKMTRLYVWSIK